MDVTNRLKISLLSATMAFSDTGPSALYSCKPMRLFSTKRTACFRLVPEDFAKSIRWSDRTEQKKLELVEESTWFTANIHTRSKSRSFRYRMVWNSAIYYINKVLLKNLPISNRGAFVSHIGLDAVAWTAHYMRRTARQYPVRASKPNSCDNRIMKHRTHCIRLETMPLLNPFCIDTLWVMFSQIGWPRH